MENGEIVNTLSYLIKPPSFPYFSPATIRVHGILSEDVQDALTFDELWPEIEQYFYYAHIFAHNAKFDIRVLRSCLSHYGIFWPKSTYNCSVQLAKKAWKNLPKYNLASLAALNAIEFKHHRAGDDARACAQIVINSFLKLGGAFPDISFEEYRAKYRNNVSSE